MSSGHLAHEPKEIIATALAAALIFIGVAVLTALFTLGIAGLLWIFFGWLILEITSYVAPGFIELNHNVLLTILSGFLIMAISLPSRSNN